MHIADDIKEKAELMLETTPRTLLHSLGIELLSLSKDEIIATMPVDDRTKQPMGLLHGGASAALAESLSSIGALLNIDDPNTYVVAIEINASHLRSVSEGKVQGIAKPVHRGRRTQVWDVKIKDDAGQAICVSRCTLAVVTD